MKKNPDLTPIFHSHHDMGGEPAGRVEAKEHDYADWERRVDAMAVLLWGIKGSKRRLTVDEHRRAIEALPPQAYDALSYYERWVMALAHCLIQRGIVSTEELAHRMAGAAYGRSHHDMGGLPAKRVEPTEHDYADWERRVDAMAVLLGTKKVLTVDQRRKNIESLPPQAYDALAYYERWVTSLAQSLIQRGMLTSAEIARKMVEVQKRDRA
jgi:hypothetical protein